MQHTHSPSLDVLISLLAPRKRTICEHARPIAEMSDRVDAGGESGRHRRGKPVAEVRANELDGERVVAVREDGVEPRGGGIHLVPHAIKQHVGGEVWAETGHLVLPLRQTIIHQVGKMEKMKVES